MMQMQERCDSSDKDRGVYIEPIINFGENLTMSKGIVMSLITTMINSVILLQLVMVIILIPGTILTIRIMLMDYSMTF